MAYRNGTYVAFHAEGSADPTASDIRYYRMLKAWTADEGRALCMIDSHEKTGAVRDTSKIETLRRALRTRMSHSKNMLLICGQRTHLDTDWVPYEITIAVDEFKIPIIVAYPGSGAVHHCATYRKRWPIALQRRIDSGEGNMIHIPFREKPVCAAIDQFGPLNIPNGGPRGVYDQAAYRSWQLT